MSILKELQSFEFDRNKSKVFGIKSAIIWGHHKNGGSYPLLYITKPKHVTQEEYEEILDGLNIQLTYK